LSNEGDVQPEGGQTQRGLVVQHEGGQRDVQLEGGRQRLQDEGGNEGLNMADGFFAGGKNFK
jgi:hypothetical protein